MVADAPKLKQLQWSPALCVTMAASAEASPWAAIEGYADNLGRAHLWQLDYGTQRALVALRPIHLDGGNLVEIAGLRSLGNRITPEGVACFERLARDVYQGDLLSMTTVHPHLARTCVRAGWKACSTVTKLLKVQ